MVDDLNAAHDKVLPQNQKRVAYFAAINKKLSLISMYNNILSFLGESQEGQHYEALEQLRVVWRNIELKRLKANLEKIQYQLKGPDYVPLVLDGGRVDYVSVSVFAAADTPNLRQQ